MLIERAKSQLLVVDAQERLAPAINDGAWVERQIGVLLDAARALSVPVIVSEQYRKGLGLTLPGLMARTEGTQPIEKMAFSCFANDALRAALTNDSTRHTIICGMEAHVCVLQTALEMREAGLRVHVVADAIGSRRPDSRQVALERMRGAGIDVVTTEMVLFEWLRTAAAPEFKAVSKLIR
ncbi:hydrolase [Dongia rigui]|uniref:Hydrolase n=1 Tax=Dongia rigui TaxID=940149 RepID=A0ABU5E1Z8_9PROT|nr:hydrolase [Dongia rigui]MDY0873387.1 hydrolase [Dongia rigui]